MNTLNNIQYPLTTVAKCVLQGYNFNFLRDEYEKEAFTISFDDCKIHYVEYLLAAITAYSMNNSLKLTPPLHIDKLWKLHVQETQEYRQFEKYVLFIYCQSGRVTSLVHLDYSNKDSRNRREEQLKQTKSLYEILGLVYINTDEEKGTNDSNDEQNTISIQERRSQLVLGSKYSTQFDQNAPAEKRESSFNNLQLHLPDNLLAPSKERTEKKILNIKVQSGPLGVTIVENTAGVYVEAVSSDRTELLVGDIIRCVGNVPVKTNAECINALKNNNHCKRTLTIERNVSNSMGELKTESSPLAQIKEHPALTGQKRTYESINLAVNEEMSKEGRIEGSTYEGAIILDE